MKLIDINLTVKGPQGCGKTRFIEKILPHIAEEAEEHFEGHSTDLMVTATEEQISLPDATPSDHIDALRFVEATRQTAQKRMNALLKELGVDEKLLEQAEELCAACETSSKRMIALSESILEIQAGEDNA